MVPVRTERPNVQTSKRVFRHVRDGIALHHTAEPAADDQIDIGVVDEGVLVNVTSIAVPYRQTICPFSPGFPHVAAIVHERAGDDLECLSRDLHRRLADRVHGDDVADSPSVSFEAYVAELPVRRTLVSQILPTGEVAVEYEIFERIVVPRVCSPIVLDQENVSVKIRTGSQGWALIARSLPS